MRVFERIQAAIRRIGRGAQKQPDSNSVSEAAPGAETQASQARNTVPTEVIDVMIDEDLSGDATRRDA